MRSGGDKIRAQYGDSFVIRSDAVTSVSYENSAFWFWASSFSIGNRGGELPVVVLAPRPASD